MAVERVDYGSDDEYYQALQMQEDEGRRQWEEEQAQQENVQQEWEGQVPPDDNYDEIPF